MNNPIEKATSLSFFFRAMLILISFFWGFLIFFWFLLKIMLWNKRWGLNYFNQFHNIFVLWVFPSILLLFQLTLSFFAFGFSFITTIRTTTRGTFWFSSSLFLFVAMLYFRFIIFIWLRIQLFNPLWRFITLQFSIT